MPVKTIALVKPGAGLQVIGNKTLKVSDGNKEGRTYKFDGAAEIDSDVTEAFNLFMKPFMVKDKDVGSSNNCFISFSTGNETFLASMDGTTGVINLASDVFFNLGASSDVERLISVSMLTIGHDGSLYDLLNPHKRSMKLQQHSKMGLRVQGLSQLVAQTPEELTQLFVDGIKVMATLQLKSLGCLFNVHIKLAPKNFKDGKMFEASSKFLHFNLTNKDGENVKRIIHQIKQKKIAQNPSKLGMLLEDCIVNNSTSIIAELRGKNQAVENWILEIADALRGFQPRQEDGGKQIDNYNSSFAIIQLRKEIDSMREKIFDQNVPNIDDVNMMERLIEDLEICKTDSWDQTILRSIHGYHERTINFTDRGMAWILDSKAQVTPDKVRGYQQKLEELSKKFKEQRGIVEQTNKELKVEIDSYSSQVASGKSSTPENAATVQKLKEKSRKEGDKLRTIRLQLHKCRENLRSSTAEGLNQTAGSFNVTLASLLDDRNKIRTENRKIVDEEMQRMELVVKHETSQLEASSGGDDIDEEKLELIKLRAEKSVLTTQLDILRRERDDGDHDLNSIVERHAKDAELQRVHNLEIFRSYREVCDEYKLELEARWRSLLDDSVKDAVFLKARNQELLQKSARISQENAELRDQLTTK